MKNISRDNQVEPVLDEVAERAKNLFLTQQQFCSEAVLTVLNRAFNGGLPAELAMRIASGFPEGLGGSGCVCGALNGGVLALGLFLGRNGPGIANSRRVMGATRRLHDEFRERFGATCCRVLTKSVMDDKRAHFIQCAGITGAGAKMAARIIIEQRPGVLGAVDYAYLKQHDSKVVACLKKASGFFIR